MAAFEAAISFSHARREIQSNRKASPKGVKAASLLPLPWETEGDRIASPKGMRVHCSILDSRFRGNDEFSWNDEVASAPVLFFVGPLSGRPLF